MDLLTFRTISFLQFRYIQRIVNTSVHVPSQAVPRINLIKISLLQVNIFMIFITFYLKNWNADVPIMMILRGIATSNQGGRGLASSVRTMN